VLHMTFGRDRLNHRDLLTVTVGISALSKYPRKNEVPTSNLSGVSFEEEACIDIWPLFGAKGRYYVALLVVGWTCQVLTH
jgi:hypothetical protein